MTGRITVDRVVSRYDPAKHDRRKTELSAMTDVIEEAVLAGEQVDVTAHPRTLGRMEQQMTAPYDPVARIAVPVRLDRMSVVGAPHQLNFSGRILSESGFPGRRVNLAPSTVVSSASVVVGTNKRDVVILN